MPTQGGAAAAATPASKPSGAAAKPAPAAVAAVDDSDDDAPIVKPSSGSKTAGLAASMPAAPAKSLSKPGSSKKARKAASGKGGTSAKDGAYFSLCLLF
jgi:hypothetical protein